jgi:hypothetical protein
MNMDESIITGMDYNPTWQLKPLRVDKPVRPTKPKVVESTKIKSN